MMNVKQILDQQLVADLKLIPHESKNISFSGFSYLYQQTIFVKVFQVKHKMETEKKVNQQINQRYLTDFVIEPAQYVLVMHNLDLEDIARPITPDLASTMGEVLSDFHREVKPFAGINKEIDYWIMANETLTNISASSFNIHLQEILSYFELYAKTIEQDINRTSKHVIHGDVGLRNYKIVAGRICLIDFEKAKIGPVFLDFTKLFYQDFRNDQKLKKAFLRGYQSNQIDWQISKVTENFLLFITALGIFSYTSQIMDTNFEQVGMRMLADVEQYLSQQ
ncbi:MULTISPECIES: phosphotransferase [unclassified Lactobacillus]|uniref:phosphotransferase n=1 Tax=unclassified Lactobacillus TaxID=2620435 RepID=UPI0013141FA6|nr:MULTISPECIES: phosphotransferase [unclassified Lactobacillus]